MSNQANILVRTHVSAAAMAPLVREALRAVDADVDPADALIYIAVAIMLLLVAECAS
jgi:hypothetical protein